MPVTLLQSQLETLEPPVDEPDTVTVEIDQATSAIVDEIRKLLGL